MAWYEGTYSCGHEGRTNIIGPTKNRQWIADSHFGRMCPECYEKHLQAEREKANKEAEEKAKEMELPELKGTEKQVAWANTLRQNLIDATEKRIEGYEAREKSEKVEKLRKDLNYVLTTKNTASWYINNRFGLPEEIFDSIQAEITLLEESKRPEVKEAIQEEKQIREASTVYPENSVTNAIVEIIVTDTLIQAKFEKNEKFREIVKSLGYEWTTCWQRKIKESTGSAQDRAAELGNTLLNAGFPIMILDQIILKNAVDGKFEKECKRWVYRRKNTDKFAIVWSGYNDKLYNLAKRLPSSKWDDAMLISSKHYKEVEDFADLNGFKFSSKALKLIEEEKNRIKVVVYPATTENVKEKDGLKEILKSEEGILDDLKD